MVLRINQHDVFISKEISLLTGCTNFSDHIAALLHHMIIFSYLCGLLLIIKILRIFMRSYCCRIWLSIGTIFYSVYYDIDYNVTPLCLSFRKLRKLTTDVKDITN